MSDIALNPPGRPRLDALNRQNRLVWRYYHGRKCAFCWENKPFDEFNRDMRRIDECHSQCKGCRKLQRLMRQANRAYLIKTVRQALRAQAVAKRDGRV